MSVLHPAAGAAVLGTKTVDLLALAGLRRPCPRCEPVSFVALLCLALKLQAPRGSLRTPPEAVCSTTGTLAPAPVPAEGWSAEAEGLAGSGTGGGVVAWAAVDSAPTECVLAIRSWILPRGGRQTVGGNRARRWTPTQQPPDDSALLRRGHGRRPPRRRNGTSTFTKQATLNYDQITSTFTATATTLLYEGKETLRTEGYEIEPEPSELSSH
jgi:hypothetical protein